MRKIVTGLLAAAALTALASGPARADTDVALLDGGGFYTFFFQGPGSDLQDADGNTIDFNFTLTSASFLYVGDGFNDGDQFSLAVNNLTTGTISNFATSPVGDTTTGAYIGDDYALAFVPGSVFSHITIGLSAGDYTVTGETLKSPFFSGAGGIQLGGSVPEPATWAMMLVGFGGLGAMLRRARRTSAALA